jgi:DNA polymerase III delta prime subunit
MSIKDLKDTFLIDRLINEAAKDKESASYLFYGDKRVDLLFYALEFSKLFLCENFKDNDYCGECSVCKGIDSYMYPDIEIINKDEQGVKIDDVRELILNAIESPYKAKKKIYILNGVEKLRKESANALLKIIEEPPKNLYFILLSKSMNIIPTIKSRVMTFAIKPLNIETLGVEKDIYYFFDGNVKDIELWKKEKLDINYRQTSIEDIFSNIETYYLYNELTELLLKIQSEKIFSDKKEYMNKTDFKALKDYLKELLLLYKDSEELLETDKFKNNDSFELQVKNIERYLKEIYLKIKVKYIQSINALGENYKYYKNSEKIEINQKVNDIFSKNKKELKNFLDRLIFIKKNKIKNLKKIIEIKNSIDNNVNIRALVTNFFMFYE